jgi:hypothetical protein
MLLRSGPAVAKGSLWDLFKGMVLKRRLPLTGQLRPIRLQGHAFAVMGPGA